jgi:hypothetical protein
MTRTARSMWVAAIVLLGTSACGSDTAEMSFEGPTGQLQATLASVPAGVACIRLTAYAGHRTLPREFPVSSGPTELMFGGLPIGTIEVTGEAFAEACSAVDEQSAPTWLSDTVTVTLGAGLVAPLHLSLRPAGAARVAVDFDSLLVAPPLPWPTSVGVGIGISSRATLRVTNLSLTATGQLSPSFPDDPNLSLPPEGFPCTVVAPGQSCAFDIVITAPTAGPTLVSTVVLDDGAGHFGSFSFGYTAAPQVRVERVGGVAGDSKLTVWTRLGEQTCTEMVCYFYNFSADPITVQLSGKDSEGRLVPPTNFAVEGCLESNGLSTSPNCYLGVVSAPVTSVTVFQNLAAIEVRNASEVSARVRVCAAGDGGRCYELLGGSVPRQSVRSFVAPLGAEVVLTRKDTAAPTWTVTGPGLWVSSTDTSYSFSVASPFFYEVTLAP